MILTFGSSMRAESQSVETSGSSVEDGALADGRNQTSRCEPVHILDRRSCASLCVQVDRTLR